MRVSVQMFVFRKIDSREIHFLREKHACMLLNADVPTVETAAALKDALVQILSIVTKNISKTANPLQRPPLGTDLKRSLM